MDLFVCFFLTGLLIICDGLHVLGPSGPLDWKLGRSVMLPCYVEAPIPLDELKVEWRRTDSETLVHLFQGGESRPESQDLAYSGRASFFTEEVHRGNFSLLLTKLNTKDAGVYRCSVYRQQETGQALSQLKEIERLVVTGGHVVSVYTGENVTLNCSVDSHIPPETLEVSWKKVNQLIPVLIFQEGDILTKSTHERYRNRVKFFSREEIQKGNFSLRLKELRTEDKGLYICNVSSREFTANTTVEVQQLGFPSLYTWILILCTLAFVVPIVLFYSASASLKNHDYSGRALPIHYTLVCCPSIAMCLAFILWGVIEGFFSEAATCSALNLLRILSLFWIAPYLDTFKGNLRRYIKRSAFAIEYAVITFLAYLGFPIRIWYIDQDTKTNAVLMMFILLLVLLLKLCIGIFRQDPNVFADVFNEGFRENIKTSGPKMYRSAERTNFVRGFLVLFLPIIILSIRLLHNIQTLGPEISPPAEFTDFAQGFFGSSLSTSTIGHIVPIFLPLLPMFLSKVRYQRFLNRGSKVLIWMSAMIILEVISASSSVYVHYYFLEALETHKEREGLTCVTVYLYVLTGIILLRFLFSVYEMDGTDTVKQRTSEMDGTDTVEQRTSEMDGTDTVEQRTSGHSFVYMLGAVGLIFGNSIALAVILILKARNGERTVKDLRVILLPAECILGLCCLMLQISAFWRTNRIKLMDDLKDLRQLCSCKQTSADSPVQNHEEEALQSTEPAPQKSAA